MSPDALAKSDVIVRIVAEYAHSVTLLKSVTEKQSLFIKSRWRMGRLIIEAIGERGKYGDASVAALSEQTGLHQNTIYECRKFALAIKSDYELDQWMEERIGEYHIVVWKHVRALIWGEDDKKELGIDGAVERRLHEHERDAERLSREMQKTADMAKGASTDLKSQTIGVANKVIESLSTNGFEKQLPPRDAFHLDFVRELPCAFCGSVPPSEPHHFETAGVGIKGSDFATVPVCRSCHDHIHREGIQDLEEKSGRSLIEEWAQTLHFRMSGQRVKIPSALQKVLAP